MNRFLWIAIIVGILLLLLLLLYATLWLMSWLSWRRVVRRASAWSKQPEYETIRQQFRVDRYANGEVWHERARLDKWFQGPRCTDVTAAYSAATKDEVRVENRCNGAGKKSRSIGRAKPVPGIVGAFAVTFMPRWLPAIWGSYTVVRLADGGRSAIVSNPPSNTAFWWLHRDPAVDKSRMPDYPDVDASRLRFDN